MKKKLINNEYIAGFVQADGSFSVTITKKKKYLNLRPVFTIVQNIKHKDLILSIKEQLGNKGNFYINKKDNTIRYQVNRLKDLQDYIIPFFDKYQLRSNKLESFIKFKYIINKIIKKEHINNKVQLLSLIVIASHLNPLSKIYKNIRYLNKQEQELIYNVGTYYSRSTPKTIEIKKNLSTLINMNIKDRDKIFKSDNKEVFIVLEELNNQIQKYKTNQIQIKLTPQFINGLFDGDGNISVYFQYHLNTKLNKKYFNIRLTYSIVQDIYNIQLLQQIKKFNLDIGHIYNIGLNYSRYDIKSIKQIEDTIISLLTNDTPIIKRFKLKKVLELTLLLNEYKQIYYDTPILNNILELSYLIINNYKQISFEQYKKNILDKL